MTNNPYTYNQQPTGQMPMSGPMPPPPPNQPGQTPLGRRRMMAQNDVSMLLNGWPKWFSRYSIITYILALMVVSVVYSAYSLPWYYWLSGVIAVIVMFLYGSTMERNMSILKIHSKIRFEKKLFLYSLIPRVLLTLILYWIFQANYGNAFGFENGDATYYDDLGVFVAELIKNGNFHFYDEISSWSKNSDIADMGYGVYVGFIYWLTGNSVITVRLLKCILSAYTVLLIYRLAKRNFGEQIGRGTAVFCALWPNFWYYCAVHLKEVEMVFLAVLFVEQADQMLRSRKFTAWKIIPILIIAAAMFTFRTPLGLVALLALIFSVVMSSTKVISWWKRIIVGLLAILLIGVTVGNRLEERAQKLVETVQSDQQKENMEWRGKREGGNSFAKYAGTAVFAPMIFTIPFPSMVRPFEGQEVQQFLNGGNFVKNIMSSFTIFAMFMLLVSGKWREHLLPLSFMLGYLVVLTMSTFAQSERFHQPVMPFEFMFAAYGLSIAVTKPKYKRWFTYWCALMYVACIAWNWFKLAGRGLV